MDIDNIRRANIRALEKEAGSTSAAAERVGMSYAQFVNLRDGAKDSRSGKRRAMRSETARRIEAAFQMPTGWLDREHGEACAVLEMPPPPPYFHPDPLIRQVIAIMESTDDAGRGIVLMAATQALEKFRPVKETVG